MLRVKVIVDNGAKSLVIQLLRLKVKLVGWVRVHPAIATLFAVKLPREAEGEAGKDAEGNTITI